MDHAKTCPIVGYWRLVDEKDWPYVGDSSVFVFDEEHDERCDLCRAWYRASRLINDLLGIYKVDGQGGHGFMSIFFDEKTETAEEAKDIVERVVSQIPEKITRLLDGAAPFGGDY